MRIRILTIVFLFLLVLAVPSCRDNRYKVNTSSVEINIEIKRLEKDLFSPEPYDIPSMIPVLKQRYKGFLQLFSYVINTGDINETSFSDLLVMFCTDKLNNEVYELTMSLYPDVKEIENGLEGAFRHYRYYFPERIVPEVFTCITGFNSSIIAGDSVLGIGLDRYLGADCEYYPRLEIYGYMAARMTSANIVSDCVYGWGASEWNDSTIIYPTDDIITAMIHEGKLKYFEKCMLPETSDEIIFGFTKDQMKFCLNNEGQMWQYLIENDLLFSTDQLTQRKLIGEAPFTSYFTNESPGRAAVWIGFRIVESLMRRSPGTNIEDLMYITDIQQILEGARYSPQ
jgi:hypothetical protein